MIPVRSVEQNKRSKSLLVDHLFATHLTLSTGSGTIQNCYLLSSCLGKCRSRNYRRETCMMMGCVIIMPKCSHAIYVAGHLVSNDMNSNPWGIELDAWRG